MKNYFLKVVLHPATHFNLLFGGFILFVGMLHNSYHHTAEYDIHGYVKKFCEINREKCVDILEGDQY